MLEVRPADPVSYIKKRSKLLNHVRQNFGEIARRRHDEAFVCARPGNKMLNALVFKHTVDALAFVLEPTNHGREFLLV